MLPLTRRAFLRSLAGCGLGAVTAQLQAAYAAAPIAEANPMRTAMVAVRLALIGFIIPFVFVYNPSLVLVSDGFNLPGFVWVTLRLVLAIWMISTAFAGQCQVCARPSPSGPRSGVTGSRYV